MRYPFLILVVLFALPICAQDNSGPETADPEDQDYVAALHVPETESLFANQDALNSLDRIQIRPFARRRSSDQGTALGDGDLCYTMHSIIVRRTHKDSDETRRTGERTCTVASRFKFKNVAPEVR